MTIDLLEACGSELPYKIEMSVNNPSTVKASLADMILKLQTQDGSIDLVRFESFNFALV